ncbi:hypothetical protein CR513_30015, partial [Mucuna pruriens]
ANLVGDKEEDEEPTLLLALNENSDDKSLWYLDNGANGSHKFIKDGYEILMKEICLCLKDQNSNLVAKVFMSRNRMHLDFGALKTLRDEKMVKKMSHINHPNQLCEECLLGKHARMIMVEDKVITLGPNELPNLVSSYHLDDRRKKLSHIEGNNPPKDDPKFSHYDMAMELYDSGNEAKLYVLFLRT